MEISAETLRNLTPERRARALSNLTPEEAQAMYFDWGFWARPEQVWRPGPERHTVYLCGRGWGKTSVGANAVIWMSRHPELCAGSIGIAGRTANDVNETMIEEGIMRWSPPDWEPAWNMGRKTLTWPNGCRARLYSGDVPKSFRGPNIGFLWSDELPHWQRAKKSWDMAMFALRAGKRSRSVVTTTPIGVSTIIKLVYKTDKAGIPLTDKEGVTIPNPRTRVVRGTTYDNRPNLSDDFYQEITEYEGTRLGMQEIHGEILLGIPGALWEQDWIGRCELEDMPELWRIVVSVDPAVSTGVASSETGIVVAATNGRGRFWVIEDASGRYTPEAWASKVLALWLKWKAWAVVIEDNIGGDLVTKPLQYVAKRNPAEARKHAHLRIERVKASKSKAARASIVCGLWEMGHVTHVGPARRFVSLEHQMTHFDPAKPDKGQPADRMDALVWAMLYLAGDGTDRAPTGGQAKGWASVVKRLGGRRPRR